MGPHRKDTGLFFSSGAQGILHVVYVSVMLGFRVLFRGLPGPAQNDSGFRFTLASPVGASEASGVLCRVCHPVPHGWAGNQG